MWRLDRHQATWLVVYFLLALAIGIGLHAGLGWDANVTFALGIVLGTFACQLFESAGWYIRRPGRAKRNADEPESLTR